MTITQEKQTEEQKELRSPKGNGATTGSSKGTRGRIRALVRAMRPRQWTKNLALFVGIVFAQRLLSFPSFERALSSYAVFCLKKKSIYFLYVLLVLEKDRQH